jgi:hypothetical protein
VDRNDLHVIDARSPWRPPGAGHEASLRAARWLIEHGFDPSSPGCEFAVLTSRL